MEKICTEACRVCGNQKIISQRIKADVDDTGNCNPGCAVLALGRALGEIPVEVVDSQPLEDFQI